MDLARELVRLALEAEGAVVEDTGDGLYALLPAAAAARLSLGEETHVGFGAGSDAEGVVDGRLGSMLVEALSAPHLAAPPLGALILPAELPRRLPAHLPVLLNGVIAGDAVATMGAERYLVAEVRLVAQSDEMRSQITTLCVRTSDGARVSIPSLAGAQTGALEPLGDGERRRLASSLRSWMQREGIRRMAGAFESVRRRLSRDLESMADFYRGLDSDMAAAARRARSDEERQRRNAKRGALGADMAARRGQLRERTRLRLSGTVVAATLVESQVQRFTLPVRRRQQSGSISLLCRSADSVFEGPACGGCGEMTLRVYLCDEKLHVLCDACGHAGRIDAGRCPACRPPVIPPPRISVADPTSSRSSS